MSKPDKKTLTTQIITDNALGSFLNYMPNPDDIVPGTLSSYDTYRQMRTDPRIKSLLNKLKTAALNFPIHFTQPEGCSDKVFADESQLKTQSSTQCKDCRHIQKWQCGGSFFFYCRIREDRKTANGLKKVKCKTPS